MTFRNSIASKTMVMTFLENANVSSPKHLFAAPNRSGRKKNSINGLGYANLGLIRSYKGLIIGLEADGQIIGIFFQNKILLNSKHVVFIKKNTLIIIINSTLAVSFSIFSSETCVADLLFQQRSSQSNSLLVSSLASSHIIKYCKYSCYYS